MNHKDDWILSDLVAHIRRVTFDDVIKVHFGRQCTLFNILDALGGPFFNILHALPLTLTRIQSRQPCTYFSANHNESK